MIDDNLYRIIIYLKKQSFSKKYHIPSSIEALNKSNAISGSISNLFNFLRLLFEFKFLKYKYWIMHSTIFEV